ncbi:hypothetical protein EIKCOROL_00961 [Eikenella corrodens ATCC 23834]|uniref:Uncharacterized protein n=1 Tax=Eikenella corrodens ATCC 23834 TaxID=546274 RepID=C0DUC8_EIKCO|nr:hypothetical protein EIKCOROL_00961 [Eikenella corrodens ATCC 23834]
MIWEHDVFFTSLEMMAYFSGSLLLATGYLKLMTAALYAC